MTDGALVRVADGAQAGQAAAAGVRPRRPGSRASSPRATSCAVGAGARATLIEAYVTLPERGGRPGQHAERGRARRRRAVHPPQGHAGGHRRHPSRQLDDDARRRGLLSRLPPHRRPPALVRNSAVRPVPGRGRQARHLRRLPRPRHRAHRHHAGGRSCRARLREPRAVQGRAGRPRARRVPGQGDRAPRRAEDRRQADGAGADAVGGCRVRLQAGARDLRRRRRLRPRLDRGRDRRRPAVLPARARHSAAEPRAPC